MCCLSSLPFRPLHRSCLISMSWDEEMTHFISFFSRQGLHQFSSEERLGNEMHTCESNINPCWCIIPEQMHQHPLPSFWVCLQKMVGLFCTAWRLLSHQSTKYPPWVLLQAFAALSRTQNPAATEVKREREKNKNKKEVDQVWRWECHGNLKETQNITTDELGAEIHSSLTEGRYMLVSGGWNQPGQQTNKLAVLYCLPCLQ